MSVRVEGRTVFLEGDGRIEDAELLLQALLSEPPPSVDLGRARSLHTALVQLLLAFKPAVSGAPGNAFLSEVVAPALVRAGEPDSPNAGGHSAPGSL